MTFFFISKSAIFKNSDLYLKEDIDQFLCLKKKKIKYASKEDIDKFLCLKNSDLHLLKIQISFYFEKFRFTSNEDANQFFCFEKFRFAFNEDANQFFD